MQRRLFLKTSGLALLGGALVPQVFVRMAAAGTRAGRKTLVVVFQRGAVDGLNVVVPYGDPAYRGHRPTIGLPRPGAGEGACLDLDGFYGLHPALAPLLPLYRDRSLAFVQAVGSPDATRSHFDAQDFMEAGTPGVKTTTDGFLSRALLARAPEAKPSPLRAVALTPTVPRILSGRVGAVAVSELSRFGLRPEEGAAPLAPTFETMYSQAVSATLGSAGQESFEAMRLLDSLDRARLGAPGADYPKRPLSRPMAQIAQLIKADVGVEVAFADVGGWDTHIGQGGSDGRLAGRLRELAEVLAAFAADLGSRFGDVVLVTLSEFGRTVRENGNRGTDHGHGNCMLLAGGGVRGGKVYGEWPGLGRERLFEDRDLAITTDFRDLLGELLTRHLGIDRLGDVFPGYASDPRRWRGLLA